jgi:hypothetical protein
MVLNQCKCESQGEAVFAVKRYEDKISRALVGLEKKTSSLEGVKLTFGELFKGKIFL